MEDRGHEDTNEDTKEDTKKEIVTFCESQQCRKLPPTKSATGGHKLCLIVANMADRILLDPTRILQNH